MDLQYGIAVNNKFSLFIDEDEDPLEILRQREEEKSSKKDGDKKTKSKSAKKVAATDSIPKPKEQTMTKKDERPVSARQGERGGGRGGRGRELRENDGSRPPRRQFPRDNREGGFRGGDENVPPEFRDRGEGQRRERPEGGFERGRGRGFGRGRGGPRGGRGGPRPESGGRGGMGGGGFGAPGERRQFDRRSGDDKTGVKSVDKRDGSGAHNWGSYLDDVKDQNQTGNPADESGEWAPPAEQTENADLNESGEAAPAKEEEENKEMTLDEYKAMQEKNRVKASFNIRKAGEGVDDKQWKKGTAYKKKPEEEEEESEEEEEEDDRHGNKKQLVTDIRITFADNPRRGGRGGRGRGEGRGRGRGRGEGRGGFGGDREQERRPPREPRGPRESAPRIENEEEFPSLGK